MMTLAAQLEKISSSGLIHAAPGETEQGYIFRHALVQEAVYESLLRTDRRNLHAAVGEALELLYPDRLDELAATLALHFERAEEREKAVQYLVRAGEAAARVYAVDEAIELFRHALSMIPVAYSEQEFIHLYDQYGRVLELAGRFEAAIEIYDQMRHEAIRRKSLRMELIALMACGVIYSTPSPLHDTTLAKALSKRAIVIAGQLDDREAQSRIYWILMLAFLFDGRISEAIVYGEQSLEIARALGDTERLAFTVNDLAHCYSASGQHEKALAINAEARLLWEKLGNVPMLVDNLNTRANDLFVSGKLEEGLETVKRAYDMACSINNEWGQVFSLMITAMITSKLGDFARTIQAGDALFALDPQQNYPLAQIGIRTTLADLYLEMGQPAQSREIILATYQIPKALKASFRPPIFACRARLALASGNLAEAESLLAQALEHYSVESFLTFSPFYVALAQSEIHSAHGEHLKALACLDDYIAALYRKNVMFSLPEHLFCKAQVLVKLERGGEAMAILQEIASGWTPLSFRRSLWRVYALMGELQSQAGHNAEAQESYRQARAYLDFLIDHVPSAMRESFLGLPEVRGLLEYE
jgi:tetratricopeptide (TPR) repeat protein